MSCRYERVKVLSISNQVNIKVLSPFYILIDSTRLSSFYWFCRSLLIQHPIRLFILRLNLNFEQLIYIYIYIHMYILINCTFSIVGETLIIFIFLVADWTVLQVYSALRSCAKSPWAGGQYDITISFIFPRPIYIRPISQIKSSEIMFEYFFVKGHSHDPPTEFAVVRSLWSSVYCCWWVMHLPGTSQFLGIFLQNCQFDLSKLPQPCRLWWLSRIKAHDCKINEINFSDGRGLWRIWRCLTRIGRSVPERPSSIPRRFFVTISDSSSARNSLPWLLFKIEFLRLPFS